MLIFLLIKDLICNFLCYMVKELYVIFFKNGVIKILKKYYEKIGIKIFWFLYGNVFVYKVFIVIV